MIPLIVVAAIGVLLFLPFPAMSPAGLMGMALMLSSVLATPLVLKTLENRQVTPPSWYLTQRTINPTHRCRVPTLYPEPSDAGSIHVCRECNANWVIYVETEYGNMFHPLLQRHISSSRVVAKWAFRAPTKT